MAIATAKESVNDLRIALSRSRCEKQHAELIGYCRPLLECDVIDGPQWKELLKLANEALANWKQPPDVIAEWLEKQGK